MLRNKENKKMFMLDLYFRPLAITSVFINILYNLFICFLNEGKRKKNSNKKKIHTNIKELWTQKCQ